MDNKVPSDTDAMATIVREGALLAGGARAILLQIAHPSVGRGVADHSDFANRAVDRLRTTLSYIYCVTFGTQQERREISRLVSAIHRKVTGPGYAALDPELQLWVAATLYDTSAMLYRQWVGPLDEDAAEAAYQQYRVLGTALQVRDEMWPADRAAFRDYWDHMVATVEVTDHARGVCHDLLHPTSLPLPLRAGMPVNRFVTAGLLPERLRQAYGIRWDERRQQRFERFTRTVNAVYPMLPTTVRELPKTYFLWDMRRRFAREDTLSGANGARSAPHAPTHLQAPR
ncbi:MAG: oxygenase MpaB family protein [Sciscionella sp.]